MPDFKFFHPIEVRYGDLDPQGHVNNASYLTYIEQARTQYVRRLGLWSGGSFQDIGIILADVHLTFRAQITFGQTVRVGARVASIGNKSFRMEYRLEDAVDGKELASGTSVLVAFDYHSGKTMPVPQAWREAIIHFEGLEDQETTTERPQ
jgi:acyl-CoA thioester hydrolase